jgi:hypothetical protein
MFSGSETEESERGVREGERSGVDTPDSAPRFTEYSSSGVSEVKEAD